MVRNTEHRRKRGMPFPELDIKDAIRLLVVTLYAQEYRCVFLWALLPEQTLLPRIPMYADGTDVDTPRCWYSGIIMELVLHHPWGISPERLDDSKPYELGKDTGGEGPGVGRNQASTHSLSPRQE
jgi:hypothetical protein